MTSDQIRIGVIALSRFLEDPRVRRQCDVLQSNGFQVFAIGEDDDRDERVGWIIVQAARSSVRSVEFVKRTFRQKLFLLTNDEGRGLLLIKVRQLLSRAVAGLLGETLRKFSRRVILVARAQRCRIEPQYAQRIFWSWNDKINHLYEKAKPLRCDIWLANDWTARILMPG